MAGYGFQLCTLLNLYWAWRMIPSFQKFVILNRVPIVGRITMTRTQCRYIFHFPNICKLWSLWLVLCCSGDSGGAAWSYPILKDTIINRHWNASAHLKLGWLYAKSSSLGGWFVGAFHKYFLYWRKSMSILKNPSDGCCWVTGSGNGPVLYTGTVAPKISNKSKLFVIKPF